MTRTTTESSPPTTAAPAPRVAGKVVRIELALGPTPRARASQPRAELRRPAQIATLLALAHRMMADLESGRAASQAKLACRCGMSITQLSRVLDLTLLAPDIQDQVLLLESIDGREPSLSERALRPLARMQVWTDQREAWKAIAERVMNIRS